MANANGEGSIYKRMREGRHVGYIGVISYTDDTGQPMRHVMYGKTCADARGKMKEARERLDNGAAVKDSKRTLADWLAYWGHHTGRVGPQRGPMSTSTLGCWWCGAPSDGSAASW